MIWHSACTWTAIVVWQQHDGTRNNVVSNLSTPGAGWETVTSVETENGHAHLPQIAVDSFGNAIAVWSQIVGSSRRIWANQLGAADGWGTAATIDDGAGDAAYPQIAMDSSGNAIVVWSQSDGTRTNIWTNRFVADSGWDTAVLLETNDAGQLSTPRSRSMHLETPLLSGTSRMEHATASGPPHSDEREQL